MVYKVHLEAMIPGDINDPLLGMPITIKPQKRKSDNQRQSAIAASYNEDGESALIHEVKRVGFLIDRYVDLQLRVGDSLVVYL